MQGFNVTTKNRDECLQSDQLPYATICTSQDNSAIDNCVGELGSGLICKNELRAIVIKNCEDGVTQYIDVSQIYNWIWLSHLDETLKLIDSEIFKNILFGVLDFVAYYINTPKIADDFEVIKFVF